MYVSLLSVRVENTVCAGELYNNISLAKKLGNPPPLQYIPQYNLILCGVIVAQYVFCDIYGIFHSVSTGVCVLGFNILNYSQLFSTILISSHPLTISQWPQFHYVSYCRQAQQRTVVAVFKRLLYVLGIVGKWLSVLSITLGRKPIGTPVLMRTQHFIPPFYHTPP